MNIAIIGSGNIGGNLGIHLAKAGHQVLFTSRHPDELSGLLEKAGKNTRSGTVADAADASELFLIAVPFKMVPQVAHELGHTVHGRVVIDASNPYPERDGQMARDVRQSNVPASGYTAKWFQGAEVVKAFNTIHWQTLRDRAFPAEGTKPLAIPYAADTQAARETIEELLKDIGFAPFYVGTLADSGEMDVDQSLYGMEGSVEDFEAKLA